MKLPKIFEQDIQSKNIQLIPLLIIERDVDTNDYMNFIVENNRKSFLFSTHEISIKGHTGNYLSDEDDPSHPGMYFSPLLLDNPVITEKIDIENRKYNISKCTFKISNQPNNGVRFTDLLNEDSLIGTKVNFAYKSINSSIPVSYSYLQPYTNYDTWADLYDDYDDISPTFYLGEIRDIKHDNDVVNIITEEIGSSFLHKELPANKLPNNTSVIPHYRDAPIPMVYGYMPKAPVVMGANKRIYADSEPIKNWIINGNNNVGRYGYPFNDSDFGALWIYVDDYLCSIPNDISYPLYATKQVTEWDEGEGTSDSEPTQIIFEDYGGTKTASLQSTPYLARNILQTVVVYKPSSIKLEDRNDETNWDEDSITSLGDSVYDWGENGDLLTEEEFVYMTNNDFLSHHEEAYADPNHPCTSEAMCIGIIFDPQDQIVRNRYKHSLFRFLISTEPPIKYFARGGQPYVLGLDEDGDEIHERSNYEAHWISFGHWVMPDQEYWTEGGDHNIYSCGKKTDSVLAYKKIRERISALAPGVHEYRIVNSYTDNPLVDHWGNEIQLGDIVRFNDYHGHDDYGDSNPEQINWHNYEEGARSPLQFWSIGTVDETGNDIFDYSYQNPYSMFTSSAHKGSYRVALGVYGWRSSDSEVNDGYQYPDGYLSHNFDYFGHMRGWLPEVTCMSICDIETDYKDMYGSVDGRVDADNSMIVHPADIIKDIFVNELGHNEDKIDLDSLNATKTGDGHSQYQFAFSQKDEINSKELIEDIAKSTFIFPRIGFDGILRFPQIKEKYGEEDFNNTIVIEDLDVISYKYTLTKKQELTTGVKLKYDYDHHHDKFFGDEETLSLTPSFPGHRAAAFMPINPQELAFNGLDDDLDINATEIETKYMRSESLSETSSDSALYEATLSRHCLRYREHYKNRHLIIKCKLPIKYLNIDVGDYVRFDKLIDGVKAYGIDYTRTVEINYQWRYPLFLCTYIKKSIEFIEIEFFQLHHLTTIGYMTPAYFWSGWDDVGHIPMTEIYGSPETVVEPVYGCTDPTALNYDPNANTDDNSCSYPEPDVYGCTDINAANYNPAANIDDGTCTFTSGCTDPNADNYNPDAYISDNSCTYPNYELTVIPGTGVSFQYENFDNANFDLVSFSITNGSQWVIFQNDPNSGQLFGFGADEQFSINDDISGFGYLFNINTFKVKYSDDSTFEAISSWDDLLPGSFTTTTDANQDYIVLSIHHKLSGASLFGSSVESNWSYTLKNTQTIIGEPIQLEWVLEVLDTTTATGYGDNIILTSHDNPNFIEVGLSELMLFNHSNFKIAYEEPFPLHEMPFLVEEEIEEWEYDFLLGDQNQDGVTDVLDVVAGVNSILAGETNMIFDINEDGVVNILDVVLLVNQILGNE